METVSATPPKTLETAERGEVPCAKKSDIKLLIISLTDCVVLKLKNVPHQDWLAVLSRVSRALFKSMIISGITV